jgi:glutaredoxin
MTDVNSDSPVTVYWAPGCSSCLRVKEYLSTHGIAYHSRNIQADPTAIADLAAMGLRRVPVVEKAGNWADGQALGDVAKLCGIAFSATKPLSVDVLAQRLEAILSEAIRAGQELDPKALTQKIPDGDRSYADLYYHVFSVSEIFLEHDAGVPVVFESYSRVPQSGHANLEDLLAYGLDVSRRVSSWFKEKLQGYAWDAQADVYYDTQSNRQFLERTTWHTGQHLRQILWRVDSDNGTTRQVAAQPLFAGLPMPQAVWHRDAE